MSLKTEIDAQIKAAMLAREQVRLMALRDIKKFILLEETKEGKAGELTSDEEMKLLTKAAKQRKDSADIYRQQNRPDLLEKELAELAVIEEFLPKQLSEDDLKELTKKELENTNITERREALLYRKINLIIMRKRLHK